MPVTLRRLQTFTLRAALIVFSASLAWPVHAAAQSALTDERVRLAIGLGGAHIFHGDFDYTAPAWEVGLGIRRSPRVSFDVDMGQWRRGEDEERRDVPIQGPSGLIGRADRITTRNEQVFTTYGFNVLSSGRIGRVRVSGGGGPGFMTFRRMYRQTLEGCSGTVTCGTTETDFSSVSATAQGLGRVEVPVASHVGLYAAARFFVNLRDVAFSGIRTTAGIQIVF